MTNNINGIDVSECSYYNKDNEPYCCEIWDNECEAQNCYFKQCKRLQEENEELKERLKTLDDEILTIEITPDEFEKYKKYKQALEEIKKWATNHNPCDIEAGFNCTKEDCFECLNYDIKKITRIIDEVLK